MTTYMQITENRIAPKKSPTHQTHCLVQSFKTRAGPKAREAFIQQPPIHLLSNNQSKTSIQPQTILPSKNALKDGETNRNWTSGLVIVFLNHGHYCKQDHSTCDNCFMKDDCRDICSFCYCDRPWSISLDHLQYYVITNR